MFKEIKTAIQNQFDKMKIHDLFTVQVDKDLLWETYLKSFPEGSNPMFRERTEHDCQCCKSFIRTIGKVVTIINGNVESLWDVKVGDTYQPVVDALSKIIHISPIENIFLSTEGTAGVDKNHKETENGIETWEHFFIKIPRKNIISSKDKGTKLAATKSSYDVFHRSLNEITPDAIETVLELIGQNSLYRGEENKATVKKFQKYSKEFNKLDSLLAMQDFGWSKINTAPEAVTHIRNTAIGTLLVDLSEGRDLTSAVGSFEAKVAPTNYKRPTALITKAMIKKAEEKVEELGFTSALERRYAVAEDITINNVLFANRAAKKKMSVFDELSSTAPGKIANLNKVEKVGIDIFVENILPRADSIELMFENRHTKNLVSLIAPVDSDSKGMFKWKNNFSWAYIGDLTDSIKERVKNAGGNVEGDLRCSLSWFNYDDLDLHLVEPNGNEIYYGNRRSRSTGGNLDVDMNASSFGHTRTPVENICYPTRGQMQEGKYKLFVNQFQKRESVDIGFEVEIEYKGKVVSFTYESAIRNHSNVIVAEFEYSHKNGLKILTSLKPSLASKELWGVSTQQFQNVSMVMNSPNHWNGNMVGNKHYFFILENCINEDKARGFFNEFLTQDLNDYRKVFEVLGSKMKTKESNNQLSGVGFSSTQRNNVFCRVKGSFSRTIKIIF